MDKPPRVDPDKLNFEIFHDLMHRPFTRECFSLYGGPRRHLALWWEYRARRDLAAATTCRLGHHRWADAWASGLGDFQMCWHCGVTREH